jgi:hypothetical protein
MRDLEIGFHRGLARALDGGLDDNDMLRDRKSFLSTIKNIMEKISSEEIQNRTPHPNWSRRGVKHAAENITTFEIAWRNENPPKSMDDAKKEHYLRAFREYGNCWSHENGDG